MKTAVVYWSGTGHTEAMAQAIAGAAGADVFTASEFSADQVAEYDAIAFGCPSMGSEQLEEDEFEPMFESVKPALDGKKIAIILRLGRRRMDAQLGSRLCRRGRRSGRRPGNLPGRAQRRSYLPV